MILIKSGPSSLPHPLAKKTQKNRKMCGSIDIKPMMQKWRI
jgi:hypothetical protein